MAWRTRTGKWQRKAILVAVFLFFFGLEYVNYFVLTWTWEKLSCPVGSHCTSLLLVADPQILGEEDEPNWITIWDSDRYLHRTFTSAMLLAKPDAVIFLGDLMDEGNRADDMVFHRYVERFFSIFPPDLNTKTLYLPGDNDIGGENGDPIIPSVVHRFQYYFHKKSELVVNSCRILKVNAVLEPIPHPNPDGLSTDRFIRIAVSHFPLLGMSTPFTLKMLRDYKPHVVFSAHSHLSRLRKPSLSTPSVLTGRLGPLPLNNKNQTHYEDKWASVSDVHEIEVPTCSYRMGVANMGYGYALFDETKEEFQYTVLWLPPRLVQLKMYLVVGLIFCVCIVCFCFCSNWRSHNNYSLLNHHA